MSTEKKPRAKRRNFAEERMRLILHCKASIHVMGSMCKTLPPEMADRLKAQIETYWDVLRQIGEEEK